MLKKKTINTDKNIILLRFLRSFSFLLCVVFICLIIPAQAESFSIDYYVSDVYTKNGTPYVTVDFPTDYTCWVRLYNLGIRDEYLNTALIDGWLQHRHVDNHKFYCYPLGYSGNYADLAFNRIDITEFPDVFDIETSCDLALTWDSSLTEAVTVTVALDLYQVDSTGFSIYESEFLYETSVSSVGPLEDLFTQNIPLNFDVEFNKADDAVGLIMYYEISFSGYFEESNISPVTYTFENERCAFDFSITDEFYQELQKGETNRLLGKIEDHMVEQNIKIDGLPGNIGNEIEGIIDNEKNEANSEGNKFVDQILNILPDPSTEVLSSLKALTDATSYTGTEAVLKIPALVLPAIDGLFPEVEIWGGAEFSFSDYLSFLPPSLLTVVQSLFTIAIVLFCVYELKGIISYCLTLNDKKGG